MTQQTIVITLLTLSAVVEIAVGFWLRAEPAMREDPPGSGLYTVPTLSRRRQVLAHVLIAIGVLVGFGANIAPLVLH